MKYIIVPNWERFQHYKHRNPVWIKCYLEELEKGERFLSLEDKDKWLFWSIVMLAAHKNNKIPLEIGYLLITLSIKTKTNLLARIKKLKVLKLIAIKSDSKSDSKLLSQSRVEKSIEEKSRVDTTLLLNKFKMRNDD
jgi:hypothetical protein